MGMKKGVNALTKTLRVGSGLIGLACLAGAVSIAFSNDLNDAGFILFCGLLTVIPAWTVAWILDSFVE